MHLTYPFFWAGFSQNTRQSGVLLFLMFAVVACPLLHRSIEGLAIRVPIITVQTSKFFSVIKNSNIAQTCSKGSSNTQYFLLRKIGGKLKYV